MDHRQCCWIAEAAETRGRRLGSLPAGLSECAENAGRMRESIFTEEAPRPVGPYSQGVSAAGFVFLSGQVGIDPSTGKLVPGGIKEEAHQAIVNLGLVLGRAGLSFDHVVKATIFVTDMTMFKEVNDVYARAFLSDPPARSTIEVAALPLGAKVEIEMIAAR
jgi:2-iminobutanoate/2-iminopropanoate deaminase